MGERGDDGRRKAIFCSYIYRNDESSPVNGKREEQREEEEGAEACASKGS